ncbi:MAG: hypothetical protein M5U34_41105 [Chloroflexi bacterium]|nr:hypothetical protein [Chloroflexota bacterium]
MGRLSFRKARQVFWQEANFGRAKIQFAHIIAIPFPEFTSARIRAAILRFIGFRIGRGAYFWYAKVCRR